VTELFASAQLTPYGPVAWGEIVPEKGPGIYVISTGGPSVFEADIDNLPKHERDHWVKGQHVVYIGRSVHLRRRLREFYRHEYGLPRPHRGGEAVTLLGCKRLVYWAPTPNYKLAERTVLEFFESAVGTRPFGNRAPPPRLVKMV
jgi:hypothetical protein